ncbi:MAG: hypothetical protein ACTSVF_00490 [Candidatus Asgardarchaeia archaeon]
MVVERYTEKGICEIKDGDFVEFLGKVLRVMKSNGFTIAILSDGNGSIKVVSRYDIQEGEILRVRGRAYTRRNNVQIRVDSINRDISHMEADFINKRIERRRKSTNSFIFAEMKVLEEDIKRAVEFINGIKGRVLIKYHGDADGLSGALIFYRLFQSLGIEAEFRQSDTAVYLPEEALKDMIYYEGYYLMLLDFANNPESQRALDIIKRAVKGILIIDHHKSTRKKGEEIVVTPVWRGLDGKYTAGYICYEIARRVMDIDYDRLHEISLFGDRSPLVKEDDWVRKRALVFDYITFSMKKEKHGMAFVNKLVEDDEMVESIYTLAESKISETVNAALPLIKKREINGITLILINVDKVVEKGSFPPRGKIVGRIHDQFKKDGPTVTIGYGEDIVMFRINEEAIKKGVDTSMIIETVKKDYKQAILSGGGHPGAAAIRFRCGFRKIIIEAILKELNNIATN